MMNEHIDKVKNMKGTQIFSTNNKNTDLYFRVNNLQYISAEYIKCYYEKLEHFANITNSLKSVSQQANDNT